MPSGGLYYFKTRAGILRLALLVTGFIAFLLAGIGIDKSPWARSGTCDEWSCPHPWLVQTGIGFLVIAWIFAIAMFFGSFGLSMASNSAFRKVDSMGHGFAGVGLLTAFVLFATFSVLGALYSRFEENHQAEIFQLVLFGGAGVLSLCSSILALVLTRVAGKSDHEPLPGLDMSQGN